MSFANVAWHNDRTHSTNKRRYNTILQYIDIVLYAFELQDCTRQALNISNTVHIQDVSGRIVNILGGGDKKTRKKA